VEGYPDVAGLFRDTADGETGHAHGHLDYLKQSGDPATGKPIGSTDKNLAAAVAGETYEYTEMYPSMAKAAREEGFADIAEWFAAYASVGSRSDHEAATLDEGRERLRDGMWLLIREASAARNLEALIPLALEYGPSRIAFCTDDREPDHVADDGHINAMVRDAVALGVAPEDALVMASLNPAAYHGLSHLGAIAPGYQADILVLPDLEAFVPDVVLKAGRAAPEIPAVPVPEWVRHTVRVGTVR